ncbi:IclR family transcriptional regulator [Micromonospora globispora]|uniref:IclR family transcriptional regulator n=1 Tax=Micromonospora globispora TaxID=1450148 RepID=UPI000D704F57|nr:IclR family transcriptional regulator C-terminal domain-containing protein [Micromonospora globispora]PWU55410.1 IclR family transcriptional regulator [Micromonospora globispora]RQW91809.1 IclR family transcriptional regulator [Micromonospora globispora]
MGEQASRTVTSKVLAILRAFDCSESTLTLTRIAEVAGLTMPTAHRLVGELVEGGALKRDGRGCYRVGRLIGKVGENAGPELRATGRAHLVEVIRLTGEACHFAIRDGDQALIRDRLYGPEQALRARKVGDRLPLHLTAVGMALLAFDGEHVREAYLAREVDGTARFTGRERKRLARELEQVRERRYAIMMQEPQAGPCSVAVPVLLGEDYAVAALGLIMSATYPRQLIRHTAALQAVAQRMGPETRRWIHFNEVIEALERGL